MKEIHVVDQAHLRNLGVEFRVGDTIHVHFRVREGDKERIQQFQGIVIRRRGSGMGETFTVRKISFGVGVERTFPVHSPLIEKIELTARARVRRSRLYYLRDLRGRKARLREAVLPVTGQAESLVEPVESAEAAVPPPVEPAKPS